jgi:branched-chain amino acid transport system substrate-binding protein
MNAESPKPLYASRRRTLWPLLLVGLLVLALAVIAAACGGTTTTTTAASAATTAAPGTTATTMAPSTQTTSGPAAQLPDKIKVGAVIPLTGANAGLGAQVQNGYKLAVAQINDAGGVDVGGTKIPIDLTILDDESDPTKTVQQMENLDSAGVVAYLGGAGSNLHAAAAPIAQKNKIPYLGIAFAVLSPHQQGNKYLFSPFEKSDDQARATFEIFDTLSPALKNIAIFQETTDWGKELNQLWTAEATKRGIAIKTYEYAPGTKDYSSLILPAKNSGADALLALPTPPDGLALMKQIKELDWNPSAILMIRAADPPTFGQNLGVDSDGVLLMPGWNPAVNFPGSAEMVAAYQAMFDAPAVALTGPAYACVQILSDSITRAGVVEPDAIRDAIAATDMDTVIGHVTFNEDGTGNVVDIINQWQGGKQMLVWPLDQANAKVIYPLVPWKDR